MGGREPLCPGVSRNEGLASRFFSVTSAQKAPPQGTPACPPSRGGGCPSSPCCGRAPLQLWPRGAAGRGGRASAAARQREALGAPLARRFPGSAPGRTRWGGPRVHRDTRGRLLPPLAGFGRDPAVRLPAVFRDAVWSERPGWSCRVQVLALAPCVCYPSLHLSRVCFRIWSSVKLYPSTT